MPAVPSPYFRNISLELALTRESGLFRAIRTEAPGAIIGQELPAAKERDNMRATVIVGPGPYDRQLLASLQSGNVEHRIVRSWPDFSVQDWLVDEHKQQHVTQLLWFRRLQWLTWAAWRRLPQVGQRDTPSAFLFAVADLLAKRYVRKSDLFVGWSQVSLYSLQRAKQQGSVTLLEHPINHVDVWMDLMRKEQVTWSPFQNCHSLFASPLIRRMKQEYQEADRIIVPSSFSRRTFLDAGLPEAKLLQIPLGVDVTLFQPASSHHRPFRILCVGRLELLKGVQYLLQAFSELDVPDSELFLVGHVPA